MDAEGKHEEAKVLWIQKDGRIWSASWDTEKPRGIVFSHLAHLP